MAVSVNLTVNYDANDIKPNVFDRFWYWILEYSATLDVDGTITTIPKTAMMIGTETGDNTANSFPDPLTTFTAWTIAGEAKEQSQTGTYTVWLAYDHLGTIYLDKVLVVLDDIKGDSDLSTTPIFNMWNTKNIQCMGAVGDVIKIYKIPDSPAAYTGSTVTIDGNVHDLYTYSEPYVYTAAASKVIDNTGFCNFTLLDQPFRYVVTATQTGFLESYSSGVIRNQNTISGDNQRQLRLVYTDTGDITGSTRKYHIVCKDFDLIPTANAGNLILSSQNEVTDNIYVSRDFGTTWNLIYDGGIEDIFLQANTNGLPYMETILLNDGTDDSFWSDHLSIAPITPTETGTTKAITLSVVWDANDYRQDINEMPKSYLLYFSATLDDGGTVTDINKDEIYIGVEDGDVTANISPDADTDMSLWDFADPSPVLPIRAGNYTIWAAYYDGADWYFDSVYVSLPILRLPISTSPTIINWNTTVTGDVNSGITTYAIPGSTVKLYDIEANLPVGASGSVNINGDSHSLYAYSQQQSFDPLYVGITEADGHCYFYEDFHLEDGKSYVATAIQAGKTESVGMGVREISTSSNTNSNRQLVLSVITSATSSTRQSLGKWQHAYNLSFNYASAIPAATLPPATTAVDNTEIQIILGIDGTWQDINDGSPIDIWIDDDTSYNVYIADDSGQPFSSYWSTTIQGSTTPSGGRTDATTTYTFISLDDALLHGKEADRTDVVYYSVAFNVGDKIWTTPIVGDCTYVANGFYFIKAMQKAIQVVSGVIVAYKYSAAINPSGTPNQAVSLTAEEIYRLSLLI